MATYDGSTRENDEKYMRRCIQLAQNGRAGAAPNPMVGAVIVCDGRIIGEGYHRRCGGPHAEVNAIRSVRRPELLERSTIYVSLEPCAHYGKTPPCADLIIEKRIPRVVVGCRDPFAKVDGLGIKKLRDAGREVTVGVLEAECLALNRRFMTFHTLKRPYITLKWAESVDGFMGKKTPPLGSAACQRQEPPRGGDNIESEKRKVNSEKYGPVQFSTSLTQTLVHRMRALTDAILVGGRTVLTDNPSLTTRYWKGTNPLRVVLDTHGDLPCGARVFDDEAETLVWPNHDLQALMRELHERNIQTLLVEGGSATLQRFIEAELWDEIRVEIAPIRLCEGVVAPVLPAMPVAEEKGYGENVIRLFKR